MSHSLILFGFVIFLAYSSESKDLVLNGSASQLTTEETVTIIPDINQILLNEIQTNNSENHSIRKELEPNDIVSTYLTTNTENEVVEPEIMTINHVHDGDKQSLKILNIPDTDSEDVATALEETIRNSVKDEIQLEQNFETPASDVINHIPEPDVRQTLTEDLMAMDYPQGLKNHNENSHSVELPHTIKQDSISLQEVKTTEPSLVLSSSTTMSAITEVDFEVTTVATDDYTIVPQQLQTMPLVPTTEGVVHDHDDHRNKSDEESVIIRQMRAFSDESDTNEISTDNDDDSKDSKELEDSESPESEDSTDSADSGESNSDENSLDESLSNSLDSSKSGTGEEQKKIVDVLNTKPISSANSKTSTDTTFETSSEDIQEAETTPTIESTTKSVKGELDNSFVQGNQTEFPVQNVSMNNDLPSTTEKIVVEQTSVSGKGLEGNQGDEDLTSFNEFEGTTEGSNILETPSTSNSVHEIQLENHIQKNVVNDLNAIEPLSSILPSEEPVDQMTTANNSRLETAKSNDLEKPTRLEEQIKEDEPPLVHTKPIEISTDSNADKTNDVLETEPDIPSSEVKITNVESFTPEAPTILDDSTNTSTKLEPHPNFILSNLFPDTTTPLSSGLNDHISSTTPTVQKALVTIDPVDKDPTTESTKKSEIQLIRETPIVKPSTVNHEYKIPPEVNTSIRADNLTTKIPLPNSIRTTKDETFAISDEIISPAASAVVVAEGLGKALPTRSVNDEPSTSSYSSENKTAAVAVICLTVSIVFVALSVALYLITFQRHHGTLDIEMQEQRCGKDDLNDDEDAETRVTLLHQLPSVDSDEQSLD